MPVNVLFAATDALWPDYETVLQDAVQAAGVEANLSRDIAPQDVDYIVYAPDSALRDFTPYTRAKAVLNLWAGVEKIAGNPTLTIPLCRMVDPAMTQGMVEWVTGHTLRHHLGIDAHIRNPENLWHPLGPPVAWDRRVTLFGLGELGRACATALKGLGFDVAGWSRTAKSIDGITTYSGSDGFALALARSEIAITLLPDTAATTNLFDAAAFAQMPKGAVLINPGRGPLIDDPALLAALDAGQLSHATLDVFRVEPVPQDHPFWPHPNITITPHIASETRPYYASQTVAENIRRGEAGLPFLHVVDRSLGY
ncbi:MAG: glyoxylate/hydroxypyruvate reductase A [Rhodobacteraceae bacterium]|nr:glyoxylate/hydroxypyruvate reductase A [Paracoccaceae bacterium]